MKLSNVMIRFYWDEVKDFKSVQYIEEADPQNKDQTRVVLFDSKEQMVFWCRSDDIRSVEITNIVMGDSFIQNLVALCKSSQIIQAIKEYRDATGYPLKESKDFIDNLRQQHGLLE